MIFTVPVALEDALWQAARQALPAAALSGAVLHAAVVDRSRRYTSDRSRLAAAPGAAAAAADLALLLEEPETMAFVAADGAWQHRGSGPGRSCGVSYAPPQRAGEQPSVQLDLEDC